MAEEEVDYGVDVEDDEWRGAHHRVSVAGKASEDDDVISLDDGGAEVIVEGIEGNEVVHDAAEPDSKPHSRPPPTGPRRSASQSRTTPEPKQRVTSSPAPAGPAATTRRALSPATFDAQGNGKPPAPSAQPPTDDSDLPEGWSRLYGRKDNSEFFWHKASNKTTRERPTGPPPDWPPAADHTASKHGQDKSLPTDKVSSGETRSDVPSATSVEKRIPTGPSAPETRAQADPVASAYARRHDERSQAPPRPLIDDRDRSAPARRPRSRSPLSRGVDKRPRHYAGRDESPPLSAKLAARDMELDKRRRPDPPQGPPRGAHGYSNGSNRDLPHRSPPSYRSSAPSRPPSAPPGRPQESIPPQMPRPRSPRPNEPPFRNAQVNNTAPLGNSRWGFKSDGSEPASGAIRSDNVIPSVKTGADASQVRSGSLLSRMNTQEDARARLRREAQEAEDKLKRIREEEARLEQEEKERQATFEQETRFREGAKQRDLEAETRSRESTTRRGPTDRDSRDMARRPSGPRIDAPAPILPPRYDEPIRGPGRTPASAGDSYRPASPPPGGALAARLGDVRPPSPRRERRASPPFPSRSMRGPSPPPLAARTGLPPPRRDGPPFDLRRNEADRFGPPPRDFAGPMRGGPPMGRVGPPMGRDGRPPFVADRPPSRDSGPLFRDSGPRFSNDRPPFVGERPSYGGGGPPSRDDRPPPLRDDRPSWRDDRPPSRDDRAPFRDDRVPFRNDKDRERDREPPRRLEDRIRPRDVPPVAEPGFPRRDARSPPHLPPLSRARSPPVAGRGPPDRFDVRRLERPLAERMSSDPRDPRPKMDERDRYDARERDRPRR